MSRLAGHHTVFVIRVVTVIFRLQLLALGQWLVLPHGHGDNVTPPDETLHPFAVDILRREMVAQALEP